MIEQVNVCPWLVRSRVRLTCLVNPFALPTDIYGTLRDTRAKGCACGEAPLEEGRYIGLGIDARMTMHSRGDDDARFRNFFFFRASETRNNYVSRLFIQRSKGNEFAGEGAQFYHRTDQTRDFRANSAQTCANRPAAEFTIFAAALFAGEAASSSGFFFRKIVNPTT